MSVRPSPADMSARWMDCVGSENTIRGPSSSSGGAGLRMAAPNPSSIRDGCQRKATSSVIRMSGMPSPVRSMKRRSGSVQSSRGSARK